jgi:hypothetical protein
MPARGMGRHVERFRVRLPRSVFASDTRLMPAKAGKLSDGKDSCGHVRVSEPDPPP